MYTTTFQRDGDEVTVQVTPQEDGSFLVHVGQRNHTVRVEARANGELRLWLDGRPVDAWVARVRGEIQVALGGQVYRLAPPRPRRGRMGAGGAEDVAGVLTAGMPGQVLTVEVAPGDTVQPGDTLLILEAMKMELRITAPTAGRVKAVHCKEGDVVERGQRLIEIEEGTE